MKLRNLKYKINWKEAWEEMRKEKMGKLKVSYDVDFFAKSAADFSRRIKSNNYEFGRKTTEILSGIIDAEFQVLEIGTGPGTLTIPLSRAVKHITGVEIFRSKLEASEREFERKKHNQFRNYK